MWQVARSNLKVIVLILAFALVTMVNVIVAWKPATAQEHSHNQNMRELLETLNTRIETEAPFIITFKFAQPLMDNDELFWEIPYYSEEADIDRWIGEIGDDFVCFYERGGSSYVVRCTPFSNILSIMYSEN
jgi:hypothetical protein